MKIPKIGEYSKSMLTYAVEQLCNSSKCDEDCATCILNNSETFIAFVEKASEVKDILIKVNLLTNDNG